MDQKSGIERVRELLKKARELSDQATILRNKADDAWLAYYGALEAMQYDNREQTKCNN